MTKGAQAMSRAGMVRMACIAMVLTFGVGGVRSAVAQSVGAGDPWAYKPDTTLVQGICNAAARVDTALNALDSALARPGASALAQFSEMFGAMNGLDVAWAALIKDYTRGNAELKDARLEVGFAELVKKRCPDVGKPAAK
jgi:hypothetical protein